MSAQTNLSQWELAELSEAEQEVFESVEIHGLRPADVARSTGREPSTVRTLLSRARSKRRDEQ